MFKLSLKLKHGYIAGTLILYSIGAWIGFILQNKFGSHYDVQMVFPIMFLIVVPLNLIKINLEDLYWKKVKNGTRKFLFSLILTTIIIVAIFPKKDYLTENIYYEVNRKNISYKFSDAYKADFTTENKIINNTKQSDCIINVYGWGVGTTYFYANRKPCTRFFLVNLLPKDYEQEYKSALIKNPPSAIVYTLAGADLDVARFEKEVFNYKNVIDNCYTRDNEINELYFPAVKGNDLIECIKTNS